VRERPAFKRMLVKRYDLSRAPAPGASLERPRSVAARRTRHSISVEHQLPDDVVDGSPLWRKRPISIEAMLQHLGYQEVPNMFPLLICQSSASECLSDFPFVARSSENRSDNSQLILRQRSSRLFHWTERSLQRRAG
jgi:hypothetical protein